MLMLFKVFKVRFSVLFNYEGIPIITNKSIPYKTAVLQRTASPVSIRILIGGKHNRVSKV